MTDGEISFRLIKVRKLEEDRWEYIVTKTIQFLFDC